MTVNLMPLVKQQFNQNGVPLAGGKLFVYAAGTTTKATTYTDSTGSVPNTNPIILDANGQASVWLNPIQYYKFVLSPSTDTDPPTNPFWTVDNVVAPAPIAIGNMTDEKGSGGTPGFAAGVDFVAGTTTTLTLSQNYGSVANLWVSFDADEQGADSFTLNGTTLTFNAPIPAGISKVFVKGGTTLTVGTPSPGTVTDASIAAGSKVANRSAMWFDVKDFGAIGNGTTDDTAAIQRAINAANAVGGTVFFSPGRYLCGALTTNAANGGTIFAVPGTAHLLPNANTVTFFTITNPQVYGVGYCIDGVTFDNTALKTSIIGISVQDYEQIVVQNITSIRMAYIINATASANGPDSFNLSIRNIVQYGSGSIQVAGLGVGAASGRCFNTIISNVSQFSAGGDTWAAPWITMQRAINSHISNVTSETISAGTHGIACIGACEGVFMSNIVIVNPQIGLLCNDSNGDTALPAYIYLSNFAVDQPTMSGADITALTLKGSNVNLTFGNTFNNISPGCFIRTGSSDINFSALKINNMYHDGLTIQSGCSNITFDGCNFTTNGTSGSGLDVNVVANNARDPFFDACTFNTFSTNGTGTVLNGLGTSRYVNSQRGQVASNGTSNQVLATFTLPANSLVNGKTLSVTASGSLASNANARTLALQIGGVTVASFSISSGGVAWKMQGDCLRIDANNVWMVGETLAGATPGASSNLQNPFNSAGALVAQLLVSTVAASDVLMHHFDVELID